MISNDRRDHRLTDTSAHDELPVVTRPLRAREARAGRGLVWPLVKGIAGVAALALIGVATLILWSLMSPPDPDASVHLVNGRLIGETSGYVARIDRESHTVAVSTSLLGLHPVVLVVNGETVITVRDRQGGFGDLWKDLPVRASYEVRGTARVARSIEILTTDAGTTPRSADSVPPSPIRPSAAVPPVPVSPAVEPPPAPPRLDDSAAPRRGPDVPPSSTTSRGTTVERPRRPASPSVKEPVTRSATPRPGVEVRPRDAPPPRANDPVDAEVPDGTAAVDWLIKELRRQ